MQGAAAVATPHALTKKGQGKLWPVTCSKITGDDDNERIDIHAGGELFVGGSVIDITGSMSSDGALTIRRSDVDEVHLKSSITPCYYRSCDDDDDDSVGHVAAKKLPRTGDPSSMNYIATLVSAGLVLTMAGLRRKNEEA